MASGEKNKHPSASVYNQDLPKIFNRSVLVELAQTGRSGFVNYLIEKLEMKPATYADFYEDCYGRLLSGYRAEYVYKNAIANKILIGRHSLRTTRFFAEFRAEQSRADVVLINGTSAVYEIKTELDNLDRLSIQLQAYSGIFDKIFVVTHEDAVSKISGEIDNEIGILLLTKNYTIKTYRKAKSNKRFVRQASIFDSLRRAEYCEIIRLAKRTVPDVPNTQIYSACREIFNTLSPEFVHDAMVYVLRNRRLSRPVTHLVEIAPHSLRAAFLSVSLSNAYADSLTKVLSSDLN